MSMANTCVQRVEETANKNGYRTLTVASNTIVIKHFEDADNGLKSVIMDDVMDCDGEASWSCEDLVVEF